MKPGDKENSKLDSILLLALNSIWKRVSFLCWKLLESRGPRPTVSLHSVSLCNQMLQSHAQHESGRSDKVNGPKTESGRTSKILSVFFFLSFIFVTSEKASVMPITIVDEF